MKPKWCGCSPTMGGHCSTCFSAAKLLPPSKDMPWHCSGSLGPCQLPCTTFWEVFGMRQNTSLCPVCVGCLEQCYGACLGLGLWGECWGSVVTELQDGSTLFWDRQRRGEGGGHVRCWGVLA